MIASRSVKMVVAGGRGTPAAGKGIMASRAPLHGYNHNVRYRNRIYHVQTEDSGVDNPHIYTHLFHGGVILASAKSDYTHLIELPDHQVQVRKVMQAQHKELMRQLKRGDLDEKITVRLGVLEPPESSLLEEGRGAGAGADEGAGPGVLAATEAVSASSAAAALAEAGGASAAGRTPLPRAMLSLEERIDLQLAEVEDLELGDGEESAPEDTDEDVVKRAAATGALREAPLAEADASPVAATPTPALPVAAPRAAAPSVAAPPVAAPLASARPSAPLPSARSTEAPASVPTARPSAPLPSVPSARSTEAPASATSARPSAPLPSARSTEAPASVPTARPSAPLPSARSTEAPASATTARPSAPLPSARPSASLPSAPVARSAEASPSTPSAPSVQKTAEPPPGFAALLASVSSPELPLAPEEEDRTDRVDLPPDFAPEPLAPSTPSRGRISAAASPIPGLHDVEDTLRTTVPPEPSPPPATRWPGAPDKSPPRVMVPIVAEGPIDPSRYSGTGSASTGTIGPQAPTAMPVPEPLGSIALDRPKRQSSGIFDKPLPKEAQLPTPDEMLPAVGHPARQRSSGVFQVTGGGPGRAAHPDPRVRAKGPLAGPAGFSRIPQASTPQRYTAPTRKKPAVDPPPDPWTQPRPRRTTGSYTPSPGDLDYAPGEPTPPPQPAVAPPPAAARNIPKSGVYPILSSGAAQPARRRPGQQGGQAPVIARPAVILDRPRSETPPPRDVVGPLQKAPTGAPARQAPGSARQAPRAASRSLPSLFGSDLITERSLDEVILEYLAEDTDPNRPK
ncbi:MAG: hypothetical protein IT371_03175 [Deltaproteobacteria bacterium]|nr:hypothetical protein [Deltaproteobacteria bacterium]